MVIFLIYSHYIVKDWPLRHELTPGIKSVSTQSLVDPQKVFLPPLHIKLGLMKNFVKAMVKFNKEGKGFQIHQEQISKSQRRKNQGRSICRPQIRELFNDLNFEASLNCAEEAAWNSFKSINENFL